MAEFTRSRQALKEREPFRADGLDDLDRIGGQRSLDGDVADLAVLRNTQRGLQSLRFTGHAGVHRTVEGAVLYAGGKVVISDRVSIAARQSG
ncbi:hypothetical protein LJR098_000857 [Rhizobium sp. LjRoot98]